MKGTHKYLSLHVWLNFIKQCVQGLLIVACVITSLLLELRYSIVAMHHVLFSPLIEFGLVSVFDLF